MDLERFSEVFNLSSLSSLVPAFFGRRIKLCGDNKACWDPVDLQPRETLAVSKDFLNTSFCRGKKFVRTLESNTMNPNAKEFKMSAAASEWVPRFSAPVALPTPPQPGKSHVMSRFF